MSGKNELCRVSVRGKSTHETKAARRRYNRRYMRRWRADPRHRLQEHETRMRAYWGQKERRVVKQRRPYVNRRGEVVCGFCWRRPPIGMVARLRISDAARNGFVKVLIPCCGEC